MPDDTPALTPSAPAKPGRLVSLDALRGFDMFWIVGADALVEGLRKVSDTGLIHRLALQLEHVGWAGFHCEDLIFPMFVFIVGVSLVFSLGHRLATEGKAGAIATCAAAIMRGADILRVHDVKEAVEAATITDRIIRAGAG